MNRLILDWLTFSIRPDEKSPVLFPAELDFSFICDLLGLPEYEFVNCGKVKYYKERYECNNISICVPLEHNANRQGYSVTMSGEGCRYYENNAKQGECISTLDLWRLLLCKIRDLTIRGLAVNISRMDIAMDDFSGLLNVSRVADAVRLDEVASRFQSKEIPEGRTDIYQVGHTMITERFYRRIRGLSVSFGSRASRSFCRIYDKKAEQMQKRYTDREAVKVLDAMPHWTRLEMEFKDENAIKMSNALCDENDFPDFFAQYVNGMLRFVDRDDSNVSRCTTKGWWLDFIGTARRTNLSCGDYRPLTRKRHLEYVYKMLSGAVYTAINLDGLDGFLNKVISTALGKLSVKHQKLCAGYENKLDNMDSSGLWDVLKKHFKGKRLDRGEYWYTDAAATC